MLGECRRRRPQGRRQTMYTCTRQDLPGLRPLGELLELEARGSRADAVQFASPRFAFPSGRPEGHGNKRKAERGCWSWVGTTLTAGVRLAVHALGVFGERKASVPAGGRAPEY